MRKIYITPILICFYAVTANAQSTYTMANFASNNDTFYLTKAQISNNKFDTTGANITWNFSTLTGNSQRRLIYRLPTQTGFTTLQWPYIANSNNVNLSSTDGQTTAVLGLQQTNPNDYFLKNNNYLREKASSYTVIVNNYTVNVKNIYDNPDTLYKFPLQYNNTNASHSAYTISIPDLYYRNSHSTRVDTVKGWGTVITPHHTYTNALQLVSNVMQIDSVAIANQPVVTNDTVMYREIKWFDPSEKNPVLYVKQTKTGNLFITSSVEYLDVQQYYQPTAAFAYVPVSPNMGDTVTFQNLSANAIAYKWNFDDATDSSTSINPQHVFANAGTYLVKLIAYNGPLSDTVLISVRINPVNQTYTFTGNGNWNDAANWNSGHIPPSPLPATNNIIINHTPGGQCILNVPQTIASGASFVINTGMNLVVEGNLRLQQ
ncbi:MAG: PKD domain-containing protein [Chitinophagaceae bacterium]|nr:PKD domain-containing protein [Chitinophagaceae bacterium]